MIKINVFLFNLPSLDVIVYWEIRFLVFKISTNVLLDYTTVTRLLRVSTSMVDLVVLVILDFVEMAPTVRVMLNVVFCYVILPAFITLLIIMDDI